LARETNYRKPPQQDNAGYRVNDQIRVREIRLVGDNLETISGEIGAKIETGIYNTYQALKWAEQVGLDLVEISPNANPPVCRIIDFKKFLYLRKKKEKEIKANTAKTVIKEVRFGPNTDDHDFEFKLRHSKKFLEEGAKVKAYVHFKGRTIVYKDRGGDLLERFVKELEEFGTPDSPPKMEGRRMHVIISPKKESKKK